MSVQFHPTTQRMRHRLLSAMLAAAMIAAVGVLSLLTAYGTGVALHHVPAETLEIVFAEGALF